MLNHREEQGGFTLIELAVVLVIVGVLIGSFVGSFTERIDTTRRDDTRKELEEIKQALLAFVYSSAGPLYALPCPDTDIPPDGFSNPVGAGACTAGNTVGTLPWATLGMGREDAWGTQYSYWVDGNYADNTTGFTLDTNSGISAQINTRANNAAITVANNAVAVVFSRGKNGYGGISRDGINRPAIPATGHDDELDNADANAVFMSRFQTEEGVTTAGGAFDDILVWINVFELKSKMVETGRLP